MTDTKEKLIAKNCPFCGANVNPNDMDTLYPSGIAWVESSGGYLHYDSALKYPKEQWCYKIICNESYSGCGAEIHGDSKEEALEKWNKRV